MKKEKKIDEPKLLNQKTEEFYSFAKKGKKKKEEVVFEFRENSAKFIVFGEKYYYYSRKDYFSQIYICRVKGCINLNEKKPCSGQGIGTFLQFWSTISRALSESSI